MTACPFIPVHPCDRPDKGGCEDICNKVEELAVCTCSEGFELTDQNTCEPSEWEFDGSIKFLMPIVKLKHGNFLKILLH